MAKKITLEGLAKLITVGFAASDKKFAALAEDIADIRDHMATKDDLAAVQKTLDDHTRRLSVIEGDGKTNLDKRLQLEVRTTRIEKHLGINKTAA